MSRFNNVSQGIKTTNLSGGSAYSIQKEQEFLNLILTSFLSEQTYRSTDETVLQLKRLIGEIEDKQFIAKAAVMARREFGMRSITHIIASELAKYVSGNKWAKEFYRAVVRRPDDMTEILSYYFKNNGKKLPNALKKGFSEAFTKFDGYQLSKYKSEDKEVSLVDIVNLVHPVPTERNGEALASLVRGKLKAIGTWEFELTKVGQSNLSETEKLAARTKVWTDLLTERKLGYLALLRNLRNIMETAPDVVDLACEQLVDVGFISRSLVFPFQFLTAYRMFKNYPATAANTNLVSKILTALSKATLASVYNIPLFVGRTLVVMDSSGSMSKPLSSRDRYTALTPSTVNMKDVAGLFGTAMAITNKADFMVFGATAKYYPLDFSNSILTTVGEIAASNIVHKKDLPYYVGHSTNFEAIFTTANKEYDRIIILTDEQGNGIRNGNQALEEYKKRTGANPYVYLVDLAGYGNSQFAEDKIFRTAGFSEKLFSFMQMFETDRNVMINTVKSLDLSNY